MFSLEENDVRLLDSWECLRQSTRMMRRSFPEIWLMTFGFLLNFPWEMLQAPFYVGMTDGPSWEITKHCTIATMGDVLILLTCYWPVAFFSDQKRSWIKGPKKMELLSFLTLGLTITILFEILATRPMKLWKYSDSMPTLLTIGLTPILQWLILPLILVYFMKRIYSAEGNCSSWVNPSLTQTRP